MFVISDSPISPEIGGQVVASAYRILMQASNHLYDPGGCSQLAHGGEGRRARFAVRVCRPCDSFEIGSAVVCTVLDQRVGVRILSAGEVAFGRGNLGEQGSHTLPGIGQFRSKTACRWMARTPVRHQAEFFVPPAEANPGHNLFPRPANSLPNFATNRGGGQKPGTPVFGCKQHRPPQGRSLWWIAEFMVAVCFRDSHVKTALARPDEW